MRLLPGLLLLAALPGAPAAQVVYRGPVQGRVIALTFDAGADRGYAGQILATLERAHIHATFGMTGTWAEANPDLVRRMSRDGDTFINHTYDHRSFTGLSTHTAPLSTAQRRWEITQTDRIVQKLTGRSTRPYFRPPFGDYDPATLTLIRRLGYRDMVMWTLDSLGWEHVPAAQIVQHCMSAVAPGTILLMHVGSQSQDGVALPALITGLRHRGYRFVTVSQLLHSGG